MADARIPRRSHRGDCRIVVDGREQIAERGAAEEAYAVVQTGERRFYGNILLTKGVVPPEDRT